MLQAYKRPIFSVDPFGVKLVDGNAKLLAGVFYRNELKLLPRNQKFKTITSFQQKSKQNKEFQYTVTIAGFPPSTLFNVSTLAIKSYNWGAAAEKDKKKLDKLIN